MKKRIIESVAVTHQITMEIESIVKYHGTEEYLEDALHYARVRTLRSLMELGTKISCHISKCSNTEDMMEAILTTRTGDDCGIVVSFSMAEKNVRRTFLEKEDE